MKRIKYSPSIIQDGKFCFVCGAETNLDHHEFLSNADRGKAGEDGLWIWLCRKCHCIYQNNADWMNAGRTLSQKIFERELGTHEEFMARYGKNYIEVDK